MTLQDKGFNLDAERARFSVDYLLAEDSRLYNSITAAVKQSMRTLPNAQ